MYSPEVLNHFQDPRNVGDIDSPDATAESQNPACGDVVRFTLKLEEGRIADIRFRAKGCVPAIACASALTELVQGRTLQQARQLTQQELVLSLGYLPEASSHTAHLAMQTFTMLLEKL